ncbi:MAG TPA: diguanylate cyclase [Xanthobacteraceae bacterium]|nr:diguanylate cyclase [Xanthobacteraceae bacterium]
MNITGQNGGAARLRWLLIAIITIAVLPVFGLYLLRLQHNSDRALSEARELAVTLAQRGADAQLAVVSHARTLAESIRFIPAVKNQTGDCPETLRRINEEAPWAASLFLLDLSGHVVCSSRPMAFAISFGDRQYFKDALRTGAFVTSEAIIGRITKFPVVAGALPIRAEGGAITGVLVLGIELSWLPAIAEQARMKHDGIVLAMNSDGGLVSRLQRDGTSMHIFETSDAARGLIQQLLQSKPGSADLEVGENGAGHIFGIARVEDMGLTVAVGFDRLTVLDPINRQFRSDFIWLLGIAAASILLAMLLTEISVLRGVGALNRAARQLKAGKIGVRVNLPRRVATELHDLSASFNSMIAEFERLAYLDRLTGLPNRRYLDRHMLAPRTDAPGKVDALLAIDLDGFKPVNDTYGHAMGDRVLIAVARRIALAADGKAKIARLGGDEFVALLEMKNPVDPRGEARAFAEALRATLDEPVEIDGMAFPVGASIGIALVPQDAEALPEALIAADAAVYEAKRAGRNRVIDQSPSIAASEIDGLLEGHWMSFEFIDAKENTL